MTATDLGMYIVLGYITWIVFSGFALSLAHHIRDNDPDPELRDYFDNVDLTHPVSIWIARKLDRKREKSKKPRA